MRRRGVVYVFVVGGLLLMLGSVAVRDGGLRRSRSTPMAMDGTAPSVSATSNSAESPPRNDGPTLPSASPEADADTQHNAAQQRPPTDLPTKPISFVRTPRLPNGMALTIDDGPSPQWTPRVLDLLARYHVHATFCLIGEQVREYPELVRRIVEEGHTLCDHTWDHDELLPQKSAGTVEGEIRSAYDAIVEASGGVKPTYYRAPGGNWSPEMIEDARDLGMVCLNWSVDPVDWSRPGTDKIVSVVLKNTAPGDVVLMHDGGGDRSQSLDALDVILPTLLDRGYSFVTP